MQTEKYLKKLNSAPARSVLCTQDAWREMRLKAHQHSWLELGGMTKNLYHGIFLNYTGFTVYDGIYFFHAWPGVNHIFYWLRKNCSRFT